jgi:hypothetical protein
MLITNIVGSTITATRGINGSYTGSHASGVLSRNTWVEWSYDIVSHPQFYIVEQDYYLANQMFGYSDFCNMTFANAVAQAEQWLLFRYLGDVAGRGDGSDGKANNLLCRSLPGLSGTKSLTTNLYENTVSVRAKAWQDWNAGVTSGPPPPPTSHPKFVLRRIRGRW